MHRILVVDDSPSILELVEKILTDAGYRADTCTNGKSAIRMLQRDAFDLILTDIFMPDEDGLEVIQKGRQICPNVPFVAMSGVTGHIGMLAVAKRMGASQTIEKPFSKARLLEAVRAALDTTPPDRKSGR
jgi:DNA-binding NtrC family response regulator